MAHLLKRICCSFSASVFLEDAPMLRVLSWNLYHYNKKLPRAVAAIRRLNPDVVCLQEVPPAAFALLEALPGYTLHKVRDFYVEKNGEATELSHLVILSRLPVLHHTVVHHGETPSDSLVGWWTGWVECVESQSVTVLAGGKPVTVVNAHLSCAVGLRHRQQELAEVMAGHVPDGAGAVVLCGDFNTFGRPWANLLAGWLFGIRLSDLFVDERDLFNAFCARHGFTQLFGHVMTHPLTLGTLDHILVTPPITCKRRHLARQRYGSDHRMLVADLSL
jgi:endonuclease/exonuclease/phosphatase family metal-dependent hydrolase